MRLLNWHLGYWFKKKKKRMGKKHLFFFKMPLEIILSPRLSGLLCSLCFNVWGRSELFLFFFFFFFLLPLSICSTFSSPRSFLKSPGHFFFKRNITSFCQPGGKRGESTEWKMRGGHQRDTHTWKQKRKLRLLVWNRAVALKCHKYFFLSCQGIRVSDLCFPAFSLFSPSAPSIREDLN